MDFYEIGIRSHNAYFCLLESSADNASNADSPMRNFFTSQVPLMATHDHNPEASSVQTPGGSIRARHLSCVSQCNQERNFVFTLIYSLFTRYSSSLPKYILTEPQSSRLG